MNWFRSLFLVLLSGSLATAGDWPQWLGPNRDGTSPEKIAPWQQAPKVLWRQAVGEGHSSPVVADGRVFIHAKIKDKEPKIRATGIRLSDQTRAAELAKLADDPSPEVQRMLALIISAWPEPVRQRAAGDSGSGRR